MIRAWRRVDAALRRPHLRERRGRVDIAARLAAWPVIAVSLTMMAIGWMRPEILDDGQRPVQTWRMEAIPGCNWTTEYDRALADLGEDGGRWSLHTGAGEETWNGRMWAEPLLVTLNRDGIACHEVRDVVRHEWIHLQQARVHGTWDAVRQAYGGQQQAEIVADCGARMLGAELTPYLDDAGRGCTEDELEQARALIDHRDV